MSKSAISPELLATINQLASNTPAHERFEDGFGFDFFLSIPTQIEAAPAIIRYLLELADQSTGSRRGHLLSLALMPFNDQVLDDDRVKGKIELIGQMMAVLHAAVPQLRSYLNDSSRLVRFWAIWGLRLSQLPIARSILESHLADETDPENRDTIHQFVDPDWRPPPPSPPPEGLPF
jgi:hypothetical protein